MAVGWQPLKSTALLDRLQSLLDLQEQTDRPPMALWPGVLPVIAIEGLLREPSLVSTTTLDLSGAFGTYVPAFTVPASKRWKLVNVSLGPEVVSAYPSAYSDGVVVMPLASIGNLAGLVVQPPEIWVLAGWTVGAIATGNVGNTNRTLSVHYLEEDAYGL